MCKILTTFARTPLSQSFAHLFPRLLLIQSLGKPLALTCLFSPNCVKPFLPVTAILWEAARQVSAKLCSQSLPGKGMSEDSLPSPRPGGRGDRHGPPLIFRDPMQTRHPGCNRCKRLRATGRALRRKDGRAEPRNGWRPAPCCRRGGGGGGGGGQRLPAGGARAINPPLGSGRAAVGARRRWQCRGSGTATGKEGSLLTYLSVHPTTYPYMRSSTYLSIYLTLHPCICLSIHPHPAAGIAAPSRAHLCFTLLLFLADKSLSPPTSFNAGSSRRGSGGY